MIDRMLQTDSFNQNYAFTQVIKRRRTTTTEKQRYSYLYTYDLTSFDRRDCYRHVKCILTYTFTESTYYQSNFFSICLSLIFSKQKKMAIDKQLYAAPLFLFLCSIETTFCHLYAPQQCSSICHCRANVIDHHLQLLVVLFNSYQMIVRYISRLH